jgi:hypothetical protein
MYKYLIVDPSIATRSPIRVFCSNAILGTIEAKSRAVAKLKAIELTGILNPIVAIYSSLSASELEMAESAPILWTQPEGQPKTNINPRGAGKIRTGQRRSATLTGLSDAATDKLDTVDNKSQYLVNLIERDIRSIQNC